MRVTKIPPWRRKKRMSTLYPPNKEPMGVKPMSPRTAIKSVPEKSYIPCRGPACKEKVLVLWGERKEYCCFDCEDWARLLGVK